LSFDFFHVSKRIKPLIESTEANMDAIKALSLQTTEQFAQMRRVQKELSLQMEELYDCMSDDTRPLIDALIALRDGVENLSAYSLVRGDEDLKRQMTLFIQVCDRKLSEAGIRRIEREAKSYDGAMDVAIDVVYAPDMEPNVIAKVVSGCYTYRGTVVKRAEVILCKGEAHG